MYYSKSVPPSPPDGLSSSDSALPPILPLMLVIPLDKDLLKHISPQNYEHITFLGHYNFDLSLSLGVNEYRRLKVEENI